MNDEDESEETAEALVLRQVMGLIEMMNPWLEAAKAYKAKAMAEGFTEEQAGQLAVAMHAKMLEKSQ